MSRQQKGVALVSALVLLLPSLLQAQSISDDMQSMHGVLEQVYNDMIPESAGLIDVARGLAGFGTLWYIAARVWKSIANAEPVDIYPLLKPFVLASCILLYGSVMSVFNGVLKPVELATHQMVLNSDAAIKELLDEKEKAIKGTDYWKMFVGETGDGNAEKWYQYTHNNEDFPNAATSPFQAVGAGMQFEMQKAAYKFQNQVKAWLSQLLDILYQAASLCIDTIRTYYLVVLTILGPLVFGFSCFDGFGHSLSNWMGRYIHIYLWLPVGNIFGAIIGKVQQNMIKIDIQQIKQYGDTAFGPSDTAYLVFLIIAIVGYTTVPNVANYIVQATGTHNNLQKMTNMAAMAVTKYTGAAGQAVGAVYNAQRSFGAGASGQENVSSATGDIGTMMGKSGGYLYKQLKGSEQQKPSNDAKS
ncbi:Bacteroides conjugative transposon TraJ protein [Chitinophaga costaii]|uniref:Bacteroides conjugative transposon TraJ protein n=1 Tax=Chitinophaga costaii TaxID=1335309 RepID=A0A1C4EWU4_9BACT|nr:conjugative transposon protein TraJ [Chitinophaga costaii]PUZ21597.1 conjugative transposon protein TraJ [Chitinophaga costaii]SCC47966.1 Bacteroides conjugative transposon TraJ protein [Chitinophaga costaii]